MNRTHQTSPKSPVIDIRTKIQVINHWNKYKDSGRLKQDVINECCDIFGISFSSFRRIRSQFKTGFKPINKFCGKKAKYLPCDNDYDIIDRIICDLVKQGVCVTINDVWEVMHSCDEYKDISFIDCSKSVFYRLMKRMKYKKKMTKQFLREELIKTPRIQLKIKEFLKEKLRLERVLKGSVTVYLDESQVNESQTSQKVLQPKDLNKLPPITKGFSKGSRYAVIQVGGEDGFVPNALKIVKNKTIKAPIFEEWIENDLMPKLAPGTIVVYDNAAVHSRMYNKPPVQSTTIAKFHEWLNHNQIEFDIKAKKKELLNLVKLSGIKGGYYVDDIIRKFGCAPLRLPPYCCHYYPIENIFGIWKGYIGHRGLIKQDKNFEETIRSAFDRIKPDVWGATIRHIVFEHESPDCIKFNVCFEPYQSEHDYFFNCPSR